MLNKKKVFVLIIILTSAIFTFININWGEGEIHHFGYPKGVDFSYFHTGAKLLDSHSIYEKEIFYETMKKVYPVHLLSKSGGAIHPPLIYMLYYPVRNLELIPALNLMTFLMFIVFIFTFLLLVKHNTILKENILLFSLLMFFFPPFIASSLYGHPSVLWLLVFVSSYILHTQKKGFWAGIVLSFLFLKPNLFFITGLIFFLMLDWKVCLGMLSGMLFLVLISGVTNEFIMWKEYLDVFKSYSQYVKYDSVVSRQFSTKALFLNLKLSKHNNNILHYTGLIFGFISLTFPALYKWRKKSNLNLEYLWMLIPISLILANPHVYAYDLIILALPLTLIFKYIVDRITESRLILMIFLLYGLSVGLAYTVSITHIQFTVLLLWWIILKIQWPLLHPKINYIYKLINKLPDFPLINIFIKKSQFQKDS